MKKYYDIEKLAKKLSHKRLREEFIGKESELYKNNYDEFIGLIYTKKGEELFNEYYESFLEFLNK
tara:strand:+ start:27 stop:221 length:195 start_codon:yes stop_codon:yes gene_type:complete